MDQRDASRWEGAARARATAQVRWWPRVAFYLTLVAKGDHTHRMRPAIRSAALLTILLLCAVGCNTDPFTLAVKASADVSAAVSAALPIVASYYTTGKINDAQKANVANFLTNITEANMKFRAGAVALHNSGATGTAAYVGLAQDFINSVPADPTAFFYFSKDATDEFNAVLLAVKAAVNGVALAVENAKPVVKAATKGAH